MLMIHSKITFHTPFPPFLLPVLTTLVSLLRSLSPPPPTPRTPFSLREAPLDHGEGHDTACPAAAAGAAAAASGALGGVAPDGAERDRRGVGWEPVRLRGNRY